MSKGARRFDLRSLAAEHGVSKERLKDIAQLLYGEGFIEYARDLQRTADFVEYATGTGPDAARAFWEMLDRWGVPPSRRPFNFE